MQCPARVGRRCLGYSLLLVFAFTNSSSYSLILLSCYIVYLFQVLERGRKGLDAIFRAVLGDIPKAEMAHLSRSKTRSLLYGLFTQHVCGLSKV